MMNRELPLGAATGTVRLQKLTQIASRMVFPVLSLSENLAVACHDVFDDMPVFNPEPSIDGFVRKTQLTR